MEEIVMDPGERTVVVECVIDNEDKIQTVNLSYSATVSDKTYPKVDEAVVRMSFALDTFYTDFEDGHTVIVDTSGCYEFVKVADGVWQAEFDPIEYAQYTLEVEVHGYDRITATTVFPPKMKIYVDGYTWGALLTRCIVTTTARSGYTVLITTPPHCSTRLLITYMQATVM